MDILVEIPEKELPELYSFYKQKAEWLPNVTGFFLTALKWKQENNPYLNCLKFYSPRNCWRMDGTIIIILRFETAQDIFVYTFDKNCENLHESLMTTNKIKFDRRTLFYAIHEKCLPAVEKFIKNKNIKISKTLHCYFYGITKDKARKYEIHCPPEVCLKPINPSDGAKIINDFWPNSFSGSEQYIENVLEANGGCGAFLKDNDKMVAWSVKFIYGNMIMLQTHDDYKKRGFATLVAKQLAKELAFEGHDNIFITTVRDNEACIRTFEKIGFERIGKGVFLEVY